MSFRLLEDLRRPSSEATPAMIGTVTGSQNFGSFVMNADGLGFSTTGLNVTSGSRSQNP
ncbi:unnamed protein product, partial [Nesidiocoris tenuis]